MHRNPLLDYLDDNLELIDVIKTASEELPKLRIDEIGIFSDGVRISTHRPSPIFVRMGDELVIAYKIKIGD